MAVKPQDIAPDIAALDDLLEKGEITEDQCRAQKLKIRQRATAAFVQAKSGRLKQRVARPLTIAERKEAQQIHLARTVRAQMLEEEAAGPVTPEETP